MAETKEVKKELIGIRFHNAQVLITTAYKMGRSPLSDGKALQRKLEEACVILKECGERLAGGEIVL